MKQWDTYQWNFPHGPHPCVILSPDARCANPAFETVNILAGQSHRANRPANAIECLLDTADGMEWETLVRCDFVWVARKAELTRRRGAVALDRRRDIGRKVISTIGLYL
jgi:mRNA-degrading endonuclease toxin of MazEF toxin-antitoxin module